ncbi:MAG: hypothetical protein ACF8Q5_04655 [Phycisphaerales bacterium JB040]
MNTAAIAALTMLAGTASAQANFSLGSFNVDDFGVDIDLNGGSVAAGTYTSYTVSVDWTAGVGGPWSSEAIWALTDDGVFSGFPSVFYADPGPAGNAANDGNPVTLTWSGQFQQQNVEVGLAGQNYEGGDPLFFNALQTFAGSSATWSNVEVTLGFDSTAAQTFSESFATGTTATGAMWDRPVGVGPGISGLGPVMYQRKEFQVDQTGVYDLASITPNHDGYLHIYEGSFNPNFQLTNLLGGGDDGAILGLGSSVVEGLTLTAGQTYVAVVSGFALGEEGRYSLNALGPGNVFIVPAPAGVAMLGLGGLLATRRRR